MCSEVNACVVRGSRASCVSEGSAGPCVHKFAIHVDTQVHWSATLSPTCHLLTILLFLCNY